MKPVGGLLALALWAAVAALWLPPLAAAMAWGVLALLLFAAGGTGRQGLVVGGLAAAALAVLAGVGADLLAGRRTAADATAIGDAYGRFWRGLEASASVAAEQLEVPRGEAGVVAAFLALDRLATTPAFARHAILMVNPAGEVVAWAGPGLLHEPPAGSLPKAGAAFVQSYSAASALVVAPLEDLPSAWRVVVGRSLPGSGLPFADPASPFAEARWALRPADAPTAARELVFRHGSAPSLVVAPRPEAHGSGRAWPRRSAALVLGLMLIAAGVAEAEGRRPIAGARRLPAAALFAAAAAALGVAGEVPSHLAVGWVLAAALGTLGVARQLDARRTVRPAAAAAAGGAAVAAVLAIGAFLLQGEIGPVTLGEDLLGGEHGVLSSIVLRLTWLLAGLGLFGLTALRHRRPSGEGTAWSAAAALLAGAALHDRVFLGLPLLALGGALVAVWLGGQRHLDRRPAAVGVGLLLVSLLTAASWEMAHRAGFRQHIGGRLAPRMGPPTGAELSAIDLELAGYFDGHDLASIEPPGSGPTRRDDLAFALWRRSPLAARDSLSALIVEAPSGVSSIFSFDLPLGADEQPIADGALLRLPQVDAWTGNLIEGYGRLRRAGVPWGAARYWLLPRPGFRLTVSEADELERELLRGRPHRRPADGLPAAVAYSLYREDGTVVASPWPQQPPLDAEVLDRPTGLATTPAGPSRYWTRTDRDGITALFLTRLTALGGLARAGYHALGTLAVLAVLLVLSLVFPTPRRLAARALRTGLRSYARRLMLVYTVLLFLPLLALNLILLRNVAERLRQDQMAEGEAALDSARTVLVDYIRGLEDGLSFDLLANRELVEWLSRIVDHQVNLYWNGQLMGSSQQALVTAGMLPGRVPGDIYARLAYLGYGREIRSRERGALTYLELYAPAQVAGTTPFILSVPLLEQQEEAARLIDRLRRQAALISAALFVVLVALGGRLARSFTDPLNQLVEGTRRIAGGAASLGLKPRELELSALVRAIDDMAGRIADGRSRLLREKQVIERMVASITSGVVSLDRDLRVLLHNRVAAEWLGIEVGVDIVDRLSALPHLAKVLDFVTADDSERARHATVRLRPAGAGDVRDWTLVWVPVPGDGDPSALLVVDDDTEVLRGQRLEAWAEMARIIAHEIKNPLTPIRLSAEHLRQVYRRDPERFAATLERCTDNILRQVEELRVIASEFSTYSRIPRAALEPGDLVAVAAEVVAAYRDAGEDGGAGVRFAAPDQPLRVRLDPILLGRAVRNLIENALRASAGAAKPVTVTVAARPGHATIEVADRGPGVPDDLLGRIFEPYFSTHDAGTGLGLPIARRIAEEHDGTIEARNRPGGGLVVAITMPRIPSVRAERTDASEQRPAAAAAVGTDMMSRGKEP